MTSCIAGDPRSSIFELLNLIQGDPINFDFAHRRISYMAKKTNKQVLIQINHDKSLFKTIKKQQFEFFGHIIRSKQPEHLAICGKFCGKNARGRPKKMYLDQLKDGMNLNTAGTLQILCDRKSWKTACALALMPGSGNEPLWWWWLITWQMQTII